jgi:WD40 repeat protein
VLCMYGAHERAVKTLAWSPDGQHIASGGDDALLRIWQPSTGRDVFTYAGHAQWIRSLCWSPDGRYVASASEKAVHVNGITGEQPF